MRDTQPEYVEYHQDDGVSYSPSPRVGVFSTT
jgi:hypothetical protein